MIMEGNTQLPVEVVERILKARDALVVGDRDEAYHQLYGIASPKFDKYYPWGEMEKQVGHIRLNEQDIINSKEVTAYATKLHQANETIKVLTHDNNRLKGEVEEEKRQHELSLKSLRYSLDQREAKLNDANKLLNEVFRKHETGLLPDRFIYENIKTFLYGE